MGITGLTRTAIVLMIGTATGGSTDETSCHGGVFVATPGEWSQQHSGRVHTIDQIGRNGYHFRVRPGDIWERERADNPAERSEISHRRRWQMESDIWFAFDMTILSGLPSQAKWAVVGQLHHSPNPGDVRGSPPWAQVIYPGRRFAIEIRHSLELPLKHNPPPLTLFVDPELTEGRRYSFVYRLRYDPQGGALDVWRNRRKIVTYRGPIGYPADVGPYLKFGIYRARAAGELHTAFVDIKTGRTICEIVNDPQHLPDLPYATTECPR